MERAPHHLPILRSRS